MLLPWGELADGESPQGIELTEGVLVLVASVLTVALIQVGLRPAWMGAGFVVAVLGRQLFSDDVKELGIGLLSGLAFSVVAASLLITVLLQDLRDGSRLVDR